MKNYTNEQIYKKRIRNQNIIEKIKLIIVIIIGIIVIYNVTLIVQSIINPKKTPKFLGIKTYSIISGSMKPEINEGDIVIVKDVKEESLKENDIITFRKNNEMITHRINKIETENGQRIYTTKGDNNISNDLERISANEIEGKVIKTIAGIGKIVIILQNKITIFIIIVVFLAIYVLDVKNQNKKMLRKKKKELLNKRRE